MTCPTGKLSVSWLGKGRLSSLCGLVEVAVGVLSLELSGNLLMEVRRLFAHESDSELLML